MDAMTHVLDESKNPPSAMVWRMFCGEACFAYEDGTLDPPLNFYGFRDAAKATCSECRAQLSEWTRSSSSIPEMPQIKIPPCPVG